MVPNEEVAVESGLAVSTLELQCRKEEARACLELDEVLV